jgi:arsenate reductase
VFEPAAIDDDVKRISFAKAFAILESRIILFTSLPIASLEHMALERQLRDIGNVGEA